MSSRPAQLATESYLPAHSRRFFHGTSKPSKSGRPSAREAASAEAAGRKRSPAGSMVQSIGEFYVSPSRAIAVTGATKLLSLCGPGIVAYRRLKLRSRERRAYVLLCQGCTVLKSIFCAATPSIRSKRLPGETDGVVCIGEPKPKHSRRHDADHPLGSSGREAANRVHISPVAVVPGDAGGRR